MRAQIASINLAVGADSALNGPSKMQAKSQVRPRHAAKPLDHLLLAEVDVELVSASDLAHNLDGCNE